MLALQELSRPHAFIQGFRKFGQNLLLSCHFFGLLLDIFIFEKVTPVENPKPEAVKWGGDIGLVSLYSVSLFLPHPPNLCFFALHSSFLVPA